MNQEIVFGVVFIAVIAIVIVATFFSEFSEKRGDWRKAKISSLFKITVIYGTSTYKTEDGVYYILDKHLREFLVATYKLHVVPGINPHNGGSTSRAEKIMVEHLSVKGFVDNHDLLGFFGEDGRDFVSESFLSGKNLEEFSRDFVSSINRERLFVISKLSKGSNLSIEEMTVAKVSVNDREENITFMPKFVDKGFATLFSEGFDCEFGQIEQVGPYWWSTEDLQSHYGYDIPGAKIIEIRFPEKNRRGYSCSEDQSTTLISKS